MKASGQAGFSLVEVVIALALLGLIIVPLSNILGQLIWIPGARIDTLAAQRSGRQAARWITYDARQASSFTPGSEPDYGTFDWVDRTGGAPVTYAARYYYSDTDNSLMREESVDGFPTTVSIAAHIANYSDVSIQKTGSLVLVSITTTIESTREAITKTTSIKAYMRSVVPTVAPTPPPYTLAWDDFESEGWAGGSGWSEDWYHTGDASIRSSDSPYEGSYHLRLRRASGYVDRPLNLSGQVNVRLQFWAKAKSFEPGETATASVSPDGATWFTVRTWVDGEDDKVYRFEDIDLSSYSMTSEFWIAFDAEMSSSNDYFWVDDLKIVRTW